MMGCVNANQYYDRKDRGMCTCCGARAPIPGYTKCEWCAEGARARQSRWLAANSAKVNQYCRDRYSTLKAAGRCPHCGVYMNGEPTVKCANCTDASIHPGSTEGFLHGESKALLRAVAANTPHIKHMPGHGRRIDYAFNK